MLKHSSWFLVIILFVLSVNVQAENCGPGKAGREAPVPVLVVTKTPEGFTPVKNVADSTKDLIKSLTKKKASFDYSRSQFQDGRGGFILHRRDVMNLKISSIFKGLAGKSCSIM